MQSACRRTGRQALDFLFPPVCIACPAWVSEPGNLCAKCWGNISFLDGPMCAACGLPFEVDPGTEILCAPCHAEPPQFDKARAIMRYDEHSRVPILALKHGDRLDLVPGYARWLTRTGKDLMAAADLIVPVPLHPFRLWRRKYNQAAELARTLSRDSGKPVDPLVLVRKRPTPSQGGMPSAKARRQNMRGAFAVAGDRKGLVKGRAILLVDDVLTTGATVNACARALKKAGAAKVFVLALARVVRAQDVTI